MCSSLRHAVVAAFTAVYALAGCALTEDQVPVKYVAPANVTATKGASDVTVAVNGKEGRLANQDRIGKKINGYGMEMASITASNDVVDLVRSGVEHELQALGFKIGDGGLRVYVQVDKFYNNFKTGFFSGDAVAEVAFTLTALKPDGTEVYSRNYKGVGKNPDIILASGENAAAALENALTDAVTQVVQDESLQKALVAAGHNLPFHQPETERAQSVFVAPAAATARVGSTPVARAVEPIPPGPVNFKVAPIGTRFWITSGGFLEIAGVDDKSIETVNAANGKRHRISMFFEIRGRESYRFDKSQAEAIWPLELGKKVQFDISGGASTNDTGTWTNEFRVLRTERIKVPAGEFETVVIEHYQRGIGGAGLGYISSTFYWYAPQAGFIVKKLYNLQQGNGRSNSWELTRIETK